MERFIKKSSIKKNTNKITIDFKINNDYKELIRSQSYIGKKGYTIPKSIISKEDDTELRKELYVKPEICGVSYGINSKENIEFPVFRENINKIYLPRFYGISRYGLPDKSELQEGDNINVEFTKQLRDYQEEIIETYMNYVKKPVSNGSLQNGGGGILEVFCGAGKCMGINTPIMMFNGEIKMVQHIKVGDVIMGDDSKPRNILSLARGREMMYKINDETGGSYIVNESHILSLKYKNNIIDMQLLEYLNLSNNNTKELLKGYRVSIKFTEKELDIEPYLFGYNLMNKKKQYIPKNYKCNSKKNQLELLAGIIDSSGVKKETNYEIKNENEELLKDIIFVSKSLGFETISYKNENLQIYKIIINGLGINEIPLKCFQKKIIKGDLKNNNLEYKIKIEKLQIDDYYGFEIDGNHRYVLGDFTVTHNTVCAIKIISEIKKKTLILVHKEFLMNQWIERINEFLPNATIGKIQGNLFDIKGNDIVIGMIQTLYDKEFEPNAFSSFGLTIIDEVHRIGSEQFSKTLLKTITPYMLGISATVDRKDKLTKILYMFIGDKIYQKKREDEDNVCVRSIKYISNDDTFNETEVDCRGNTKYSSMIVKLCDYGPRSDFILRILKDLIEEEEDKQIMVLCHNRSLLVYLYEGINHRKISSVGYYVGGMKQSNLLETEKKQIVLATYSMAAEALDIKTLSTLVMVTPKTDITQSVGRILRMKHEKPIIVDIVDQHSIFRNQWIQRKRFYKKSNYQIREIDSNKYTNMNIEWETDNKWARTFDPRNKNLNKELDEDIIELNKPIIGKCLIKIDGLDEFD